MPQTPIQPSCHRTPTAEYMKLASVALCIAICCFHGFIGRAQDSQDLRDLKSEVEALKRGQAEVQRKLQEIDRMLETRQAYRLAQPTNTYFSILDPNAVQGSTGANLVLVEFSDYQCSVCGEAFANDFSRIKRDYIDT